MPQFCFFNHAIMPSEANWAIRYLEYVIGRLYAFEAQIHFQLPAMMRGMGEVSPQPFEARHLTVLRSGQGVQLFGRHGRDGLITEIEGVAEELHKQNSKPISAFPVRGVPDLCGMSGRFVPLAFAQAFRLAPATWMRTWLKLSSSGMGLNP